jgi:hypothetical protein
MVKALTIHALRMWFGCGSDVIQMRFGCGSGHYTEYSALRAVPKSSRRIIDLCQSVNHVAKFSLQGRTAELLMS